MNEEEEQKQEKETEEQFEEEKRDDTKMVKCILCLEYPTIPGPKFLDIFSEEGTRLGISGIINKHFWIKVSGDFSKNYRFFLSLSPTTTPSPTDRPIDGPSVSFFCSLECNYILHTTKQTFHFMFFSFRFVFGIQTYRNGDGSGELQQVCMTCWEVVRDFHILYERVEEVHKHLGISTIDLSTIDDPLPHQDVVMLKSEDRPVPMMLQDPIMSHGPMGDNLFDPEVKVEVNDLDFLPQIEIIETEPDMPNSAAGGDSEDVSEQKPTRSRRSRAAAAAARDQSPKTTTAAKRIKKEASPTLDKVDSDDDYDDRDDNVDVFADSGPVPDDSDDAVNKSMLSSSLDQPPEEEKEKEKEVRTRRGRPRKSEAEKAAARAAAAAAKKAAATEAATAAKSTPAARKRKSKTSQATAVKNEGEENEEPSCSTSAAAAAAAGVSEIKTEESAEDAAKAKLKEGSGEKSEGTSAAAVDEPFDIPNFADDDDDDPDFGDNDNDFAAKDSDDSSNSESDEEHDSDASDWAADKSKTEKFAVILKKERNTPKKYKKREKTAASEPKRMSKEDIAARQAQQAEYDNIITKFFEKLRCPKCELLVHTFSEMRAHFRLDHNDDHGFVECCGRRFTTRKFLAEHIMVHYNPEHFKCKTCNKICRDSTQLETHEQTHLPNPPEAKYKKTFQCEKCSKTFSSKASFEHHMVAKHVPREEFKFECPECKKK